MAARFEIVSLRQTDAGSTWLALLLEGEALGQFRFATPCPAPADEIRALIHDLAVGFDPTRTAIAQFRELEAAHESRRIVALAAPLAAA